MFRVKTAIAVPLCCSSEPCCQRTLPARIVIGTRPGPATPEPCDFIVGCQSRVECGRPKNRRRQRHPLGPATLTGLYGDTFCMALLPFGNLQLQDAALVARFNL